MDTLAEQETAAESETRVEEEPGPAAPEPESTFKKGQKIFASLPLRGGGRQWYSGTISGVQRAEGSVSQLYDVSFDDGDKRKGMSEDKIRPRNLPLSFIREWGPDHPVAQLEAMQDQKTANREKEKSLAQDELRQAMEPLRRHTSSWSHMDATTVPTVRELNNLQQAIGVARNRVNTVGTPIIEQAEALASAAEAQLREAAAAAQNNYSELLQTHRENLVGQPWNERAALIHENPTQELYDKMRDEAIKGGARHQSNPSLYDTPYSNDAEKNELAVQKLREFLGEEKYAELLAEDLIGKRVKVPWKKNKWYEGTVTAASPASHRFGPSATFEVTYDPDPDGNVDIRKYTANRKKVKMQAPSGTTKSAAERFQATLEDTGGPMQPQDLRRTGESPERWMGEGGRGRTKRKRTKRRKTKTGRKKSRRKGRR